MWILLCWPQEEGLDCITDVDRLIFAVSSAPAVLVFDTRPLYCGGIGNYWHYYFVVHLL